MKKISGKYLLIFSLIVVFSTTSYFGYIHQSALEKNEMLSLSTNTDSSFSLLEIENVVSDHFVFAEPLVLGSENIYQEQTQENIAVIPETEVVQLPVRSLCGEYLCYTGEEFLTLYNDFELSQSLISAEKYIYDTLRPDNYLKQEAEKRGYQKRLFADESDMISFENVRTYPEVRDAYISMRNKMINKGIRLHFVSGYRSSTDQRAIFTDKMGDVEPIDFLTGIHNEKLDMVLSRSALPGYSKHHSGYAVDFGCGNDYLVYEFASTKCFQWMSANNFENAKQFGFIPSYPDDVESQGPNPEPWEFVWVGTESLE